MEDLRLFTSRLHHRIDTDTFYVLLRDMNLGESLEIPINLGLGESVYSVSKRELDKIGIKLIGSNKVASGCFFVSYDLRRRL